MNRILFCLLLSAGLHLIAGPADAADRPASKAPLKRILQQISEKHGFEIDGLYGVGEDVVASGTGTGVERLERLLIDYNYILLQKPNGGVERLIITGRKRAAPPPVTRGAVATRRRGRHHIVEAFLRGPDGAALNTDLMVDTGASTIVLPLSMAPRLGFVQDRLREAPMRTANRTVRGYVGVLQSVEVGGVSIEGVGVAFVEDDRLQGTRLLGMSFLRRFRVTIDDENNRITLIRTQ